MPGYDDELLAEIRMLGDLVAHAGASSEFLPRAVVDATLEITQPSDGHTSDATAPGQRTAANSAAHSAGS